MKHTLVPYTPPKGVDVTERYRYFTIDGQLYQKAWDQTFLVPAKTQKWPKSLDLPDSIEVLNTPNHSLICGCGEDTFKVTYPAEYNTTITCISCHMSCTVHDG